ncbi:YndM family protein [Lederbergia panacisoli]|uniref:YndM family protein n=1 Tax=Lederbergia panacisoli TaxID=1255251 RepID=UPI00214B3A49|nr:YndM family protein [Lederbergia panacisoli]MCR2822611.1 YndM family protein [Lederbergia panacisoli]
MLNLIMKLIVCPIIVIIAANFLTNVNFPYVYQPIVIGITLAVVGHLMEIAILQKGTFWISNAVDFVTSALIIYFLSYFFAGADVTMGGAIITAALLTVVEFFVHLWLIRSGRARKEPSL